MRTTGTTAVHHFLRFPVIVSTVPEARYAYQYHFPLSATSSGDVESSSSQDLSSFTMLPWCLTLPQPSMAVLGRAGVHNQVEFGMPERVHHQGGRMSYLWNTFNALFLLSANLGRAAVEAQVAYVLILVAQPRVDQPQPEASATRMKSRSLAPSSSAWSANKTARP